MSVEDVLGCLAGGFALALFVLFFIVLNRTLTHAGHYETTHTRNLKDEAKFVWRMLWEKDKNLIVWSCIISWAVFSVAFIAIAQGAEWVWHLGRFFDRGGEWLMKHGN